jgi:MFS family permease
MRTRSTGTASPEAAAPAELLDRWAWHVLMFLWFAYLLNYVNRQVVFSIFPALRRDLQFSSAELGLIGSVFTWIYSLCSPFVGRLVDLARRDLVVAGSLLLWSLATLANGMAGSVTTFLVWRVVLGITEAFYVPAAAGVIGALHPSCSPFPYLTLAVNSLPLLKLTSSAFGFFAGLMIANLFASAYDVISRRNYGPAAGTLNMLDLWAAPPSFLLENGKSQSVSRP